MTPADVRDWALALAVAAICGAVAIFVLWLLADLALDAVKAAIARRRPTAGPSSDATEGGSDA